MKIIDIESRREYEITPSRTEGEESMQCPKCSKSRTKSKDKPMHWNIKKETGYCHHCNTSFSVPRSIAKPEYKRPEWHNNTELSDAVVRWFEKRGISQFTLRRLQVTEGREFMPQAGKEMNTVQFNYFRDGELINVKYRTGDKKFKMFKDGELIFYNVDAIHETDTAIITEGEIDTLSLYEAGIHNVVSVPNGASAGANNLQYLDNCTDYFEKKTSIILATDNDLPGVNLRNELASRLGVERCYRVSFKDCKDANEYLQKYGKEALAKVIEDREAFPVEGIFTARDLFDDLDLLYKEGLKRGLTVDDTQLDECLSFERGRLYTITGIPGHGKSEFLDQWLALLNIKHGLKFGYFSPENYPLQLHQSKLISRLTGSEFGQKHMPYSDFIDAMNYVSDNFFWVMPRDEFNLTIILERARYLVFRRGIAGFVIDPYNKLEHRMERGESETNYISRFLDQLINFAHKNNVAVFLVAHPRKMQKERDTAAKKMEVPNLYDINGSANFYNKTDFGITIYRDFVDPKVDVHIQKVKFKHLGRVGRVSYTYNLSNGRFETLGTSEANMDTSNWMKTPARHKLMSPEIDFWEQKEEAPF